MKDCCLRLVLSWSIKSCLKVTACSVVPDCFAYLAHINTVLSWYRVKASAKVNAEKSTTHVA